MTPGATPRLPEPYRVNRRDMRPIPDVASVTPHPGTLLRTRWRTPIGALAVLLSLALAPGCKGNNSTPTAPTTPTTPTTTVAAPNTFEDFTGTITVGGFSFYSFTVAENGTINLTLNSVGGPGVPSSVWIGMGLGTPSGEDCATTTSINTQSGSAPQITGTLAPGVYCARVYDIGNLAGPASFSVTIAHP